MQELTCTHLDVERLDDHALLQAVLEKDERAWQELLRRARPVMLRCIVRTAARHGVALGEADKRAVLSDVCFALLHHDMRKLRQYDPSRGAKLLTWLGLLSIHAAYDYLRDLARHATYTALDDTYEPVAAAPDALEVLIEQERWSHLTHLLRDFSERDRHFVDLYYRRGMEPEEVASAMRISVGTVHTKSFKVRVRLQALVQKHAA